MASKAKHVGTLSMNIPVYTMYIELHLVVGCNCLPFMVLKPTSACTCLSTYMYRYACMYVCVCTHVHACVCMHVYSILSEPSLTLVLHGPASVEAASFHQADLS